MKKIPPAPPESAEDSPPAETSATAVGILVTAEVASSTVPDIAPPATAPRVPSGEAFWKGVARFQKLR